MNEISVDVWSHNSVAYLPKRLGLHTDFPVYNHPLEVDINIPTKKVCTVFNFALLGNGYALQSAN